jgi:hypothetical protein
VGPATIVSLVIGAWGAILATTLAVVDFLRNRRGLKVFCVIGHAADLNLDVIRVAAVNESRRPIEARSVTFRLADGKELFAPEPISGDRQIPRLLTDGQSAVVFYPKQALDELADSKGSSIGSVVVADGSLKEYRAPYPREDKGGGRTGG